MTEIGADQQTTAITGNSLKDFQKAAQLKKAIEDLARLSVPPKQKVAPDQTMENKVATGEAVPQG